MATRINDTVARPLRTVPQGGLAWAVTEGIDAFAYNLDERQYGVLVVILTIVISFVQATIEDGIGKALLRDVSKAETPLVDDSPELDADAVDVADEQRDA